MDKQLPFLTTAWSRLSLVLFMIGVILFGTMTLFLTHQFESDIFNSPDEVANYYFTQQFEKNSNFFLTSPSEENLPQGVEPRSMLRVGANFIPVGFVGFPLFLGLAGKVIGMKALPYLLAALSGLAVLAWYNLVKTIFGRRLGILSGFLLLIHPAYFFYSLRPFSPNIFFVNLLIFAAYLFTKILSFNRMSLSGSTSDAQAVIPLTEQAASKRRFISFLFGFILSLAVAIRPSEIVWLGVGLIVILIIVRHALKPFAFLFAFLGGLLPVASVLYFQNLTYGSPLATGYPLTASASRSLLYQIKDTLFPFGLDLVNSWQIFSSYVVGIFWWLAVLALVGIVAAVMRWHNAPASFRRKIQFWLLFVVCVTVWLTAFYGPWSIYDRLDKEVSIGTSFVRYFLPVYILFLPVAAYGVLRIMDVMGNKARIMIVILVMAAVFLSLRIIFWGRDESLLAIWQTLEHNQEIRQKVLPMVSRQAIIITERSDKIFFPYREVMGRFRHPREQELVRQLARNHELWYETIFDRQAIMEENRDFWEPLGLRADSSRSIGYGHTLYKLTKITP